MSKLGFLAAKYVRDSLCAAADEDYLVARWAACSGLLHQFTWSAAQSIEKNVKSALFLNRICPKRGKSGHDIIGLFAQFQEKLPELIPSALAHQLPDEIIARGVAQSTVGGKSYIEFSAEVNTKSFIKNLNEQGEPSSRYRDNGGSRAVFFNVHYLDSLIYQFKIVTGQIHHDTDTCKNSVDCSNVDETARDLIKSHFGLFAAGFAEGRFQAERRRALWFQNAAFFPMFLNRECPPIGGLSARNNSFAVNYANASKFGNQNDIDDFSWLEENAGLSKRRRSQIDTEVQKILGRPRRE